MLAGRRNARWCAAGRCASCAILALVAHDSMESDATVVCAFVESQVAAKQEGWVALDSVYPYTGLSKGVCHFNRSTAGVNTACAAQETQATQRAIAWLRCGDEAAVRAAVKTNVTGYANVTAADETALQAAVWSSGVISAAINSDADAFMFYSGGPLDRIPACTLNCRCTCGCITFDPLLPLCTVACRHSRHPRLEVLLCTRRSGPRSRHRRLRHGGYYRLLSADLSAARAAFPHP